MSSCSAHTKSGRRCLNRALRGSDLCTRHSDQVSDGEAVAAAVGAAFGNVLLPGLGGMLLGGLVGPAVRRLYREDHVRRKRVFISFDFDHDRALKDFVIGQSRLPNSPFDVIDSSLKEAAPERDWQNKARAAIRRADIVLVIAGERTHRAHGVLTEVAMAREEGIPIVQMIGYESRNCPAVPNAGRLYAWSWDNLKNLLS